jgi:Zn-dependent protease with chaperone function
VREIQLSEDLDGRYDRLSRDLGARALAGLLAVSGSILVLLGGAVVGAVATWEAIGRGTPVETLFWVLFMLGSIAAIWATLASLASLAPRPCGLAVARERVGELYALVDALAHVAGVSPIRRIYVTGEINASIVQRPRHLGVGEMATDLLIGLPLAHALGPRQLAAVIAHEIGHMVARQRGMHGRSGWLQAWWMRTLDELAAALPSGFPWFDPQGDALCMRMLLLAQMEEYAADRTAVRLVGAELLAGTLVELCCKADFLANDYLPRVHALAECDEASCVRPYREMGHGFAAGFAQSSAAIDPQRVLRADAGDPFHPALQDRLVAIGVAMPERLQVSGPSAAQHFFGDSLPFLAWHFDRIWLESLRDACPPALSPHAPERVLQGA